jgi:hypothetical protein
MLRKNALYEGYGFSSAVKCTARLTALQAAEKVVFRVGRGFIPGINVVIAVAFRP